MIAVNKDLQNPAEAAKTVAENVLFGTATELGIAALGAIGKAIKTKIKAKIPLTEKELKAIDSLPEEAKTEVKAALPETMPGEIGKQTPVKQIDNFIREGKQKVEDLRYQRTELGIDTTKEIEAAEKRL